MKTNEKLNVTDARVGRANAAPSDSAPEIVAPHEVTEGNEGNEELLKKAGPDTGLDSSRGKPSNPNSGSGEFISKKELAWRLRVTVRTISNWQGRGLVPFVKCRRAIYYDWSAVAAHLRARARVRVCKPREGRVMRIPVIGTAGEALACRPTSSKTKPRRHGERGGRKHRAPITKHQRSTQAHVPKLRGRTRTDTDQH